MDVPDITLRYQFGHFAEAITIQGSIKHRLAAKGLESVWSGKVERLFLKRNRVVFVNQIDGPVRETFAQIV